MQSESRGGRQVPCHRWLVVKLEKVAAEGALGRATSGDQILRANHLLSVPALAGCPSLNTVMGRILKPQTRTDSCSSQLEQHVLSDHVAVFL